MVFSELQTEIHSLSRHEKYRLVQLIVMDLAQEESLETNDTQNVRDSEAHYSVKAQAIDSFLRKWKGVLKGVDPDDAKYRYLLEK